MLKTFRGELCIIPFIMEYSTLELFFFFNIAILQCLSRGLKVGFIAVVTYSVIFVCSCASPNVHLKQALPIIKSLVV